MEEIPIEYPGIEDLENCWETIRKLHSIGIIHGDVNRYTLLLTQNRTAKIIDFEASTTKFNEESVSRNWNLKK